MPTPSRPSSSPSHSSGPPAEHVEADLLEQLAWEYYLTDQRADAITACQRAMRSRQDLGESAAVSAHYHALDVGKRRNAVRTARELGLLGA